MADYQELPVLDTSKNCCGNCRGLMVDDVDENDRPIYGCHPQKANPAARYMDAAEILASRTLRRRVTTHEYENYKCDFFQPNKAIAAARYSAVPESQPTRVYTCNSCYHRRTGSDPHIATGCIWVDAKSTTDPDNMTVKNFRDHRCSRHFRIGPWENTLAFKEEDGFRNLFGERGYFLGSMNQLPGYEPEEGDMWEESENG